MSKPDQHPTMRHPEKMTASFNLQAGRLSMEVSVRASNRTLTKPTEKKEGISNRLLAIEPGAREIAEAIRALVDFLGKSMLRMQTQHTEAEKNLYAQAVLEELFPGQMAALVTAHDNLASALNKAYPDAVPVISLATAAPA